MSFFDELQRRNVICVWTAYVWTAYVVTAWLLIQISETILPVFDFTEFALSIVIVVLAIGLIPVLVSTWAFEFTPEGLKREHDVDRSRPAAARGRITGILTTGRGGGIDRFRKIIALKSWIPTSRLEGSGLNPKTGTRAQTCMNHR